MSILSSTIPIVHIQNTRTVIDYSGKIIHTKKQGGRVGRCSAKPGSRRPPPSSVVLDHWNELFCEFSRVGAGRGQPLAAIRQVFGEAGHTTKTT